MKTKTLEVLFHEQLKDIYYAERKILKALPKMARGTQSSELRAAVRPSTASSRKVKRRSRNSPTARLWMQD